MVRFFFQILLREALFTSESVKLGHVRACVRLSVRPDNNWFLRRGYEGCRNAAGHWQFELWILAVLKKLKKDLQKLGLTNGIWWFRDPDLDPVLTMGWIFFFKTGFFKSRWYQGRESSRNQWIWSDVIWRVRIVGSEFSAGTNWWERSLFFKLRRSNASRPCLARCI